MARPKGKKHDLVLLAKELEATRLPPRDGKVAFEAFASHDIIAVLASSVPLSDDLPQIERVRIVRQAIVAAAEKGRITAKSLVAAVGALESSYLKAPRISYVVATSVSIKPGSIDTGRVSVTGSTLAFTRKLPRSFDRSPLSDRMRQNGHDKLPRNYLAARVSVTARSHDQAFALAMDRLDYLRGIWNFYINRRIGFRISSGPRKPVNQIGLGPVHSLHLPDGRLASADRYWYEPDFVAVRPPHNLADLWGRVRREEGHVRNRVRSSEYSSELVSALIRYARALDGATLELCYLKLWSLLEFLTDTGRRSYDQTIKRCLFISSDRAFEEQVLEHLRNRRNELVHSARVNVAVEHHLYQLKHFVENLLLFHLKHRFESRAEAGDFLDHPFRTEDLRDRARDLRKRLTMTSRALAMRLKM